MQQHQKPQRQHPKSMRETYKPNRRASTYFTDDEGDAPVVPTNKLLAAIKHTRHRKKSVSLLTSMKEREKAIRSMQIPVVPRVPINFEKITRSDDGQIKVANYIVVGLIGEGNGGRVFLAEECRTGTKAAIKVIDKLDDKCLRKAMKEAGAMSQVGPHKHVVDLLGIVENEDCVCLIMEYADGGDLFEYIKKNRGVERDEAWRMFEQLVNVVSRIHQLGFIHRDIKPENIFLDAHHNVLLGDWGYAAPWSFQRKKQRPCGSLNYAASEILTNTKYYGPEIDVFALGGVLYTMLTGKLPFGYAKNKETFERVLAGAWRKDPALNDLEVDLLNRMFAPNPHDRATMKEVKEAIGWRKLSLLELRGTPVPDPEHELPLAVPALALPKRSSTIAIGSSKPKSSSSASSSPSGSPRRATPPPSPLQPKKDSPPPSPTRSPAVSPPASPVSSSGAVKLRQNLFNLKVFSRVGRRRLDFDSSKAATIRY